MNRIRVAVFGNRHVYAADLYIVQPARIGRTPTNRRNRYRENGGAARPDATRLGRKRHEAHGSLAPRGTRTAAKGKSQRLLSDVRQLPRLRQQWHGGLAPGVIG